MLSNGINRIEKLILQRIIRIPSTLEVDIRFEVTLAPLRASNSEIRTAFAAIGIRMHLGRQL